MTFQCLSLLPDRGKRVCRTVSWDESRSKQVPFVVKGVVRDRASAESVEDVLNVMGCKLQDPTKIYCDNEAVKSFSKDAKFRDRTRHIDIVRSKKALK